MWFRMVRKGIKKVSSRVKKKGFPCTSLASVRRKLWLCTEKQINKFSKEN